MEGIIKSLEGGIVMEKQNRLVNRWGSEETDIIGLLKLCSSPIEIMDAVVGLIYKDVFTVVGGHSLSINAPLNWMKKEAREEMLLTKQLYANPGVDVMGGRHIITPPRRGVTYDYQQIAPYSKKVYLSQNGKAFLERWMELLSEEWRKIDEIDDEYNPFSLAFLHNHPIIRPEYLSTEIRTEYEVAYDLSGSSLSFTEWLKQLGQETGLSIEDQEFIRTQTTDGIALLVSGAKQYDIETKPIANFVKAWQIRPNGSLVLLSGKTYRHQDMMKNRKSANFLYTITEIVRTTARQALKETSFWPTFAAHTDHSLHIAYS